MSSQISGGLWLGRFLASAALVVFRGERLFALEEPLGSALRTGCGRC